MEKRKLVLTIIGVVILVMVIMVYISTFQKLAGMKRRINKQ